MQITITAAEDKYVFINSDLILDPSESLAYTLTSEVDVLKQLIDNCVLGNIVLNEEDYANLLAEYDKYSDIVNLIKDSTIQAELTGLNTETTNVVSESDSIVVAIGKLQGQLTSLSSVSTTGNYEDLNNKPLLAEVATTGSYTDLVNKPVARPSRQVVATRGVFPTLIEGGTSNTRYESHIKVNTGEQPCTSLRLHYAAMRSRDAEDSVLSISDFNLQSSIVYNNQFFPNSIGGTTITAINPAALPNTNSVGIYLPANSEITIKTGATVAATGYIPGALSQTMRTKKVASTSTTSQINTRFDVTIPSGGSDTTLGLFPVMVTGIPLERYVAIAGWGDSLMAGVGDVPNNSNGCMGWFEHACHAVDGGTRNIPFTNLSKSGDTTLTYSADEAQARFSYLEYVTHVIFGMGNNDIMSGRTLAQMQDSHLEAWAHARLFGCKVGAVTLTPRTTSTDNWATTANQTPMTNYTTAGIRGQFNSWLALQKQLGNLDFIIDINSVAADTTNPDVFKAGFTYDGTHWGASSTQIVAAYAKTQLLLLEV